MPRAGPETSRAEDVATPRATGAEAEAPHAEAPHAERRAARRTIGAPGRWTARVFAAGLVAWTVVTAIVWLGAPPLGHDEAQYALAASDLLAGAEPRWFYVSPGTSLLAVPGIAAGGGEVALRLPVFLLGIGFVLAAAAVAWRCFGAATAAWVAVVLAGMRSFTRLGAELLSDLPATALLLAGTAVIAAEVTREDGPRWRTLAAAPLLAAALYLRYASCVPIAILGAAALACGLGPILRRPAPIAATAALFLALLVPHARTAIAATGSPLGILLGSKDVPHRAWIAEGLADYVTANPFVAYGVLAPPVLLAGAAAIARLRDRRTALLWTVAVLHIVAIGLISHAQVRYIAYGLALLVVLGVDVLRRAIAARPDRVRRALGAAAAIALAASWVLVARAGLGMPARRAAALRGTLDAARVIRADAAGAPCQLAGRAYTQLEWYSGCRSSSWPWEALGRERIYVVLVPPEEPGGTRGTPRVLLERPDVTVTRYDP